MTFTPVFFPKASHPDEKAIVDSCILAYCINSETEKPFLAFDGNLVSSFFRLNQGNTKMENLSLLLGFSEFINQRFEEKEIVLNIRQLFAISFFANQMINHDAPSFFELSSNLIKNILNAIKTRQELTGIVLNGLVYFFLSITTKIKVVPIDIKYLSTYIDAVLLIMNRVDASLRHYLLTFLFTLFFAFPGEKGTDLEMVKVIKQATIVLHGSADVEFNFIALVAHLIKLLVSDFTFETQVALFMLVSLITDKYPSISDFVLDEDNSRSLMKFIFNAVSQSFIEPVKRKPLIIEETEFSEKEIVDDTFNNEIDYRPKYPTCKIIPLEKPAKFGANILNILLSATLKLCNSTSNKTATNIKMIDSLLTNECSFGAATFAINWIKYVPLTESSMESIRQVLLSFIRISFIMFEEKSLMSFCFQFLPLLIRSTKSSIDMLFPPLEAFAEAADKFMLTKEILELVNLCIFCDPERFYFVYDALQFNLRIAEIIKKQHVAAMTQNNDRIRANREIVFSFLQSICSIKKISASLIRTPEFMLTIANLVYESKCSALSLAFMEQVIMTLTRNDSSLLSLFEFFEKILHSGPLMLCKEIINIFLVAYKANSTELSAVLLQTQFIQETITFSGRFPEENELVFKLLNSCTDERTSRLFSSLSTVMNEADADKVAEELFENNFKTNPAALGIVFDAFGPEKKKSFLEKVLLCCKASEKTTLVINTSELPSRAIKCLSEYRSKYERDELFTILCEFLSYISELSMKSNDLISLIQTLSSLPGNFRPFFTIDVLNILKRCFESTYSSPTSLFKLYGSRMMLPDVLLKTPITDFTFFCEVKFRSESGTIFCIRDINGSEIALEYINNKLCLSLKDRYQIKGAFTGEFSQKKWYKLAVVYSRGLFYLYVHGTKQASLQGRPIQFIRKLTNCEFGTNLKADFGSFGLCTTVLTDQEIDLLYHFPSIPCNFSPYEIRDFDPYFTQLFSGKIYFSSIYQFNASMTNNNCAVNMAPVQNTTMMKLQCQTFSFPMKPKDALTYIGGISVILPFFAQLDQPFAPKPGEEVVYAFDQYFLPTLLDLLKSLLERSESNQQELFSCDGFKIISYLLSKSKLEHLTNEVIIKFKGIFEIIYYPQLAAQMLNCIFFDPQIWIYLPLERQQFLFQTILEIFQSLPRERQVWFATAVSFSRILCIMRVCYWSNITDPQVCLLQTPKIDPTTKEIEAQRPVEIMPKLRNTLWIIANRISDVRFTLSDANTLCFFSFDLKDIELTISTLSFLLKFLHTRPEIILPALRSNFKFLSFFPLFISSDQKLRGQCMHLFMKCVMLPVENRKLFLNPYTFEEWINIIICTISNENTTTLLPDLVYGYMFGLYDSRVIAVMPKVRISKAVDFESFAFTFPQLMPLCLMLISYMKDEVCIKYMNSIKYTAEQQYALLFNTKDWDYAFLLFIISRLRGSEMDESTKICVNLLLKLYCFASKNTDDIFKKMSNAIIVASAITGNNYSFLRKQFISSLLDSEYLDLIKNEKKSVDSLFGTAFSYLFIIPNSDLFYETKFDDESYQETQEQKSFTFQELYKKMLSTSIPDASFTYASRTTRDGKWFDADFAEKSLITMKQFELDSLEFFNFSFIVGIGLQHEKHFSTFVRYIRDVTNLLSTSNFTEDDVDALSNYMSGLIKTYMKTDYGHPSHIYLQEDTQSLAELIDFGFKQRMNWGSSLSSFDSCFSASGHNYAHSILEKYNEIETRIERVASKKEESFNNFVNDMRTENKKYMQYLSRLNQEDSTRKLDVRSEQIRFQMFQYASNVRNAFARGQKLYTKLWRTIGQDNGAWSSPELNPVQHWKLSNILTSNYKRGIMVRNFQFKDHKNASILRDVGNPYDAAELYKKHVTEMRVTELTEGKSVVSLVPEDKKVVIKEENENEFVLKLDAKLITTRKVYSGTLILYNDMTVFESSGLDSKIVHIKNKEITHVFTRQYLLLDTAIEIFSIHQSHLFDFNSNERNELLNFYEKLPHIKFIQREKDDIFKLVEKATEKWRAGKISNFDYLMKLNLLSGRTYNDLSKYPVFPWVIKDYQSKTLDLDNPDTFRDLSMPIGAVQGERFNNLLERMNNAEREADKYLYGSFYSSAAVVIGFLIRMEPFTSLHIELQSGKFDISDRLFNSIPRAWESVCTIAMDYRELIPEFFYLPDFLVNENNFDLGKQSGDVILPPWASNAQDFVTKNAAALESPFVTATLPRWIDLIFGCSSRGEGAVEAKNTYCPNFYESVLTEEAMNDPQQLSFLREYVACFGHASQQLFFEPHKGRSVPIKMFPFKLFTPMVKCKSPIIGLTANDSIITAIEANYICSTFDENFAIITSMMLPHQAPVDTNELVKTSKCISLQKSVAVISQPWNPTFAKVNIGTGEILTIRRVHTRPITCVSYDPPYTAAAATDCTVTLLIGEETCMTLTKHRSVVSCVSVNKKSDAMITASIDGMIIQTSLSRTKKIHTSTVDGEPLFVSSSDNGFIAVVYFSEGFKLACFDANLSNMKSTNLSGSVDAILSIYTPDGNSYAILSVRGEGTVIYNLITLEKVIVYDCEATAFAYDKCRGMLIRGNAKGEISQIKLQK